MKVLVTGGTGSVGSHLVLALLNAGHEVTVLARDPNKIPLLIERGAVLAPGDLEDFAIVREALQGHEACIHTALIWPDDSDDNGLRDAWASAELFRAAVAAGVEQIIYTSSTAVHRPFHPIMNEATATTPSDSYSATKLAGEAGLMALAVTSEVRANILRPGPVVGVPVVPGGPFRCDRRLREMTVSALRGAPIQVEPGGRQFIGVRDLAEAFVALLESDLDRQTILVVAQNITLWSDIARRIIRISKSWSQLIEEAAPGSPPWFDSAKLKQELDLTFDSTREMDECLAHLIASTQAESA